MIKHLACIMDGNRRWARLQGKLPVLGHQEGVKAGRRVIQFCLEKKIPYLSFYTFSIENFKRSAQEQDFIFNIVATQGLQEVAQLRQEGVRIRFVGDRALFPPSLISVCDTLEQQTQDCTALQVNLLFCYGARQEIIGGIKKIIRQVKAGVLDEDDINEESFNHYLWTQDFPDPDLIIRTGGVSRLSNFLLYQAAYSELYFLDCLWPDIGAQQLEQAVSFFDKAQRNFGV
jgi:undecaprenyl diphosphate synthase